MQETDNSSIHVLSQIKTQDDYGITDARFDAAYRRRQSLNQPIPRQSFSQRGLWTTDTEEAFLPTQQALSSRPTQQTLLSSQMLSALLPTEPQLALTQPPQQAVVPVVPVVEAEVKDEKGKPN